jgi:negative regulator of flagellin synthesis FlgM
MITKVYSRGGTRMKINNIGLRAIQSYNQAQPIKKTQKTNETFADKIEISSQAKEMQISSSYANERASKVSQLKEDISAGNYEVNARKVAQDMLNYYRG